MPRDTILRFRNHPSIVVWCGRNEGVPQPIINEAWTNLISEAGWHPLLLRQFQPDESAEQRTLHYQPTPKLYFTTLNRGFSVELGTPSMSTLEVFQASIAARRSMARQRCLGLSRLAPVQVMATLHPFMQEMRTEFGAATSLAGLRAQGADVELCRSSRHLRRLQRTPVGAEQRPVAVDDPAGVAEHHVADLELRLRHPGLLLRGQESREPVHVQMNLPGLHAAIVNNTEKAIAGATLQVHAVRGDGTSVFDHQEPVSAPAQAVTTSYLVDVGLASAKDVVFVEMELKDAQGALLSQNFYWYAADSETYRGMNSLPQVAVTAKAVAETNSGGEAHVSVALENTGTAVAVAAKLTLLRASDGERILPAYYSDNYLSLLPGEKRVVEISFRDAQASAATIAIRGWNVVPARVEVQAK